MTRSVCVCTSSAILSMTIRSALARSRQLGGVTEARDVASALAADGDAISVLIVDADLLRQGSAGLKLSRALMARNKPTVVIDARALGVPVPTADNARIATVLGRVRGELDLGVVDAQLVAAVGRAINVSGRIPITTTAPLPHTAPHSTSATELIVLGVSTGGPVVLQELLRDLNEPAVPVLIVQHMPANQTSGLARRLSEECQLQVCEVHSGPLPIKTIGLLRGGGDYRIARSGSGPCLRETVLPGNPFHPNIDEVLLSALASGFAVGAAILSGMGRDGAAGSLAIAQRGYPVVAQLPETCSVAGMPQAAIDNGAARWIQSPRCIADTLNRWSDLARRPTTKPEANESQ